MIILFSKKLGNLTDRDDIAVPIDEGMPEINPEKICFVVVKCHIPVGDMAVF